MSLGLNITCVRTNRPSCSLYNGRTYSDRPQLSKDYFMKNLLLCTVIFILLLKKGFSQLRTDPPPITEGYYKICGIDSVESVYIIYAQKYNSIIKIASPKKDISGCIPIEVGQYYDLRLESRMYPTASKLHIGGIKVNGVLIKIEGGKVVWDLFRCLNMNGLCIMPLTDI